MITLFFKHSMYLGDTGLMTEIIDRIIITVILCYRVSVDFSKILETPIGKNSLTLIFQ